MRLQLPFPTYPLILLLCGPALAIAQDYAPFGPASRKLFASLPDHANTFSLAFDSAVVNGPATTYYNLFALGETWYPSNCGWWGPPACQRLEKPTWAGPRIDVGSDGMHTFFNDANEPLHIPFQTDDQDTVLMYADATQQFLLSYDGAQSMDILGYTDDVRHWTVLHRDLAGNPINSALNGSAILVGRDLGLLRFFRTDSFPAVLAPVELVGQAEPGLGLFELSPAAIEDHQPGDEIQFRETHSLNNGPPSENYTRFRKYTYLQRTDTPDSVRYRVRQELFYSGGTELTVDTITLAYIRTYITDSIPFEAYRGYTPVLNNGDYCGLRMWALSTPAYAATVHCTEENCWGPYDTGGPPPEGDRTLVVGLGEYHYLAAVISPNGFSAAHDIVYFRKNGTVCSQEVSMAIAEAMAEADGLRLGPNPADGAVSFVAHVPIASVEMLDLEGRCWLRKEVQALQGTLDVQGAPAGLYAVRFTLAGGHAVVRRIVVE